MILIPKKEMKCRRAFEAWMRSIGKPGELGVQDPLDYRYLYQGWKACWELLKGPIK